LSSPNEINSAFRWGFSIGFVLCALLAFVLSVAIAGGESPAPLSDRVNVACKKGYYVYDWRVGDEFSPLPKGTVQVICEANETTTKPSQYKVMVERP
jgi:hypothetical protein